MHKTRECGLNVVLNGLPALSPISLGHEWEMELGLQSDSSSAIFLKVYGPTHTHWAQRTWVRGHSCIAAVNPLIHPAVQSGLVGIRLSSQNRKKMFLY